MYKNCDDKINAKSNIMLKYSGKIYVKYGYFPTKPINLDLNYKLLSRTIKSFESERMLKWPTCLSRLGVTQGPLICEKHNTLDDYYILFMNDTYYIA